MSPAFTTTEVDEDVLRASQQRFFNIIYRYIKCTLVNVARGIGQCVRYGGRTYAEELRRNVTTFAQNLTALWYTFRIRAGVSHRNGAVETIVDKQRVRPGKVDATLSGCVVKYLIGQIKGVETIDLQRPARYRHTLSGIGYHVERPNTNCLLCKQHGNGIVGHFCYVHLDATWADQGNGRVVRTGRTVDVHYDVADDTTRAGYGDGRTVAGSGIEVSDTGAVVD